MKNVLLKYYSIIPILLFCVFYIIKAQNFVIHDFANYYFGSYFLKEGLLTTDIYFPYYFNSNIAALGYQNIFVSYAPNTPFLSILFYPFTFLPITISKLVFNVLTSGLFLFSLIRLISYFKIKKEYVLLLPLLFFIPLKNNLLFGQVYFLLFFLLSEGFLAYEKKQYKTMALFWSFAIFLKVFPIILGVFLLFKKEYKALKYLILFCVIILTLSISLNGFNIWQFYFTKVLPKANNGEIAGAFVDNYQSFFMFLKRLFVFDEVYNPTVILHQPNLFKFLLTFIKVILVGISVYITKYNKNNLFIFSFWLLISILISPYGSTYTFILCIFIYLCIIILFKTNLRFFLLLLLFTISNSSFFHFSDFPTNFIRLFILLIFTVLIIWQFKKKINFKMIVVIAVLLGAISFLLRKTKINFTNFLKQKTPILIYNYVIKNDTLVYHYFNEYGKHQQKTDCYITNIETENLELKNNQIFYKGRQLTFTNSNKIKPILLNKKYIVFLSDDNRGIGFYELQKIILDK